MVAELHEAARDAAVPVTFNRVGSMFTCFFTDQPVTNWDSAAKSDAERFGRFHRAMLDKGVWLPPSQFEAAFLSAAHSGEDLRATVQAARTAFSTIKTAKAVG